jgi:hypothetical protein
VNGQPAELPVKLPRDQKPARLEFVR